MICQFCESKIRGSIYGCKKCKPKLISAYFENDFDNKQIAVVISANNKTFAGYLPLREVEE